MQKKIIFIITLSIFMLNVSACSSIGCFFNNSHNQNTYSPDPFWNNPRIIFRNVLVPVNGYHSPININSSSSIRIIHPSRFTMQKISQQNTGILQSIKYSYGSSVNDSFNGITEPFIPAMNIPVISNGINSTSQTTFQPPSQQISSININALPPTHLAQIIQARQQQGNMEPGTTNIPLTFPMPPPPAMMKAFHMQISSGTSN